MTTKQSINDKPEEVQAEAAQDNLLHDAPPHLQELMNSYHDLEGPELLEKFITSEMKGKIALVSSFGAEAVVLLHMVAQIDNTTPVLFIDTGKLFPETLAYHDELVKLLGLTDVRRIGPTQEEQQEKDPDQQLYRTNTSACCRLRKGRPLGAALKEFDGWITGRKRFQSRTREEIETVEIVDGRIKLNPLAHWNAKHLKAYIETFMLPRHPLVKEGFLSIGCTSCTTKVEKGEDARAGRWRGQDKTECGIHFAEDGKVLRKDKPPQKTHQCQI